MRPTNLLVVLLILGGCRTSPLLVHPDALVAQGMNASVLLAVSRTDTMNGPMISGIGSAVVVNWGGIDCIVTAWHVVKDSFDLKLLLSGNGHTQLVGPFEKVGDRDLAWARLNNVPKKWTKLEVSCNCDDFGACTAWGFPETEGVLSDKRATDNGWITMNDVKYRWFSGIVISGMSGGPILDDDNRVIAIISCFQVNKPVFFGAALCDIVPLSGVAPLVLSVPEVFNEQIESSADLGFPTWVNK